MPTFNWFDPTTWPAMSGNFSQPILPDWSFMTINETNSSSPATEQRMLTKDSYGRQIGRMLDALDVLVKEAEARNPSLKGNDAFTELAKIQAHVTEAKAETKADRLAKLSRELKALKASDPTAFKTLIDET